MKIRRPALLLGMLAMLLFVSRPEVRAQLDSADQATFSLNQRMGRGINVPTIKRMTPDHYRDVKKAGFDHVRIPIHPFRELSSETDFTLPTDYVAMLDSAVNRALANDLIPIIDFHEHHAMQNDPLGNAPKFYSIWQQLAEHFRDAPADVLFEIANEPNMKPDLWNDLYTIAYRIIRKSNPDRTLLIGTIYGNQMKYLKDLELPEADRNIIVTVHYYEPIEFTHQGAEWSEKRKHLSGIEWPTEAMPEQDVIGTFAEAQAWSEAHRRPLHLGEFGVYNKTEMPFRIVWTDFVARQAEKLGWSWCYWELNQGFGIYDLETKAWKDGLYHALIPEE